MKDANGPLWATRMAAVILAVATVMSVGGCGGGGENTLGQIAPLHITLVTDKASYLQGETVAYTYSIANPSDQSVTLDGEALAWHNAEVGNLSGVAVEVLQGTDVVWSATGLPSVQTQIVVPAQGAAIARTTWDQTDGSGVRVPSGVYVIRAYAGINAVNGSPVTSIQAVERVTIIRIE